MPIFVLRANYQKGERFPHESGGPVFQRFSLWYLDKPVRGPARFYGGKPGSGTNSQRQAKPGRRNSPAALRRIWMERYEGRGRVSPGRVVDWITAAAVVLPALCDGEWEKIADRISLLHPNITAIAVIQEKRQNVNGKENITCRVMLPVYVFLFSNEPILFCHIFPLPEEDPPG